MCSRSIDTMPDITHVPGLVLTAAFRLYACPTAGSIDWWLHVIRQKSPYSEHVEQLFVRHDEGRKDLGE
jgi:hypothetical protein